MNYFYQQLLYDRNSLLTARDRGTHTYVIGQPGMGKSRALESWVMQDVAAGHGVGVIDPHGDLFNNLILQLAGMPRVWERVVIIDPCDRKWVTPFNPLEAVTGYSQERLSLFLTDIIGKIWKLDLASAPRTMWLLSNSFLALSDWGLALLDLPIFLLDRNFREGLLPRMKHIGARSYFQNEFPKSQAAAHQWATPVLNKIGGLIFDPDTSLMLAGKSRFSFREVLDRRLILMVNLPKGILGEGASALMGAFIVAHIQKAALARANTANRIPFFLYLDEFQNYTTDNIKDILSESRKYALSLTLVHQYPDQLSSDMCSAVLNTAGALACFRVGHQDSTRLVKEIFPNPDFLMNSGDGRQIFQPKLGPFEVSWQGQHSSGWENLAQTLSRLPSREFWFRRRGPNRPSRHRTFDVPQPIVTAEIREKVQALFDTSGRLYGKLKKDAQQQNANNHQAASKSPNQSGIKTSQGAIDGEDSFWSV